jgi:hypothetical protein
VRHGWVPKIKCEYHTLVVTSMKHLVFIRVIKGNTAAFVPIGGAIADSNERELAIPVFETEVATEPQI